MKMFICCTCKVEFPKTGRNQKRCPPCAKSAQAEAIHAWAVRTGKFTGSGSGAHNTPGRSHPQWRHGERAFEQRMAPDYWRRTRYCERCRVDLVDAAPEFRCVHHRDHDRSNNVESNFELLCKRCHQVEHECWNNFTGGATTIPKGSTPKRVEAHSPEKSGDDIV